MLSFHHIFPQKLFNWWSTHPSIRPAHPAGAYYCWPWAVPSPSKYWHIETANCIFITLGNLKSQMNISSSSVIWNMCVYLHVENEKCLFHNHVKTNVLATVCVDWWPWTEMISPVSPSQRHCPSLFLDNQPAGHTSTDHKSHLLYLLLTHCSITTEQPLYSLASHWNVRLYLYTKENRKVYNHRI